MGLNRTAEEKPKANNYNSDYESIGSRRGSQKNNNKNNDKMSDRTEQPKSKKKVTRILSVADHEVRKGKYTVERSITLEYQKLQQKNLSSKAFERIEERK